MSQTNKICPICNEMGHSKFYCKNKPFKPIKRKSKPHEIVLIKKQTVKKPSRSKLKKKLDKLVKDYVKIRDDHTCQHCHKKVDGVSCQGSHVFSVGSCPSLQFEPLNIKVLCAYCHLRWWHSSPIEATEWFKKTFPERLEKLNDLKLQKNKLSTADLQDLIDKYTEILKNIS